MKTAADSTERRQTDGARAVPFDELLAASGALKPSTGLCLAGPFPAKVRLRDGSGAKVQVETVLESLSDGYLCLRLGWPLRPGEEVFVVAKIHKVSVAMHGKVLYAEPDEDCKLAVSITHYRFM